MKKYFKLMKTSFQEAAFVPMMLGIIVAIMPYLLGPKIDTYACTIVSAFMFFSCALMIMVNPFLLFLLGKSNRALFFKLKEKINKKDFDTNGLNYSAVFKESEKIYTVSKRKGNELACLAINEKGETFPFPKLIKIMILLDSDITQFIQKNPQKKENNSREIFFEEVIKTVKMSKIDVNQNESTSIKKNYKRLNDRD